jgi:hypothetical protein
MQLSAEQWSRVRAHLAAGPKHVYLGRNGMVMIEGVGMMPASVYLDIMDEQEMLYGTSANGPEFVREGEVVRAPHEQGYGQRPGGGVRAVQSVRGQSVRGQVVRA